MYDDKCHDEIKSWAYEIYFISNRIFISIEFDNEWTFLMYKFTNLQYTLMKSYNANFNKQSNKILKQDLRIWSMMKNEFVNTIIYLDLNMNNESTE